ncbi:hypothetical protein B0H16DRAFT_1449369 [Mycena metata]|uniref:Uncharacterized protein n=1 Tax=Mycena metata TaxID=1033252 RepID=A0AAD7K543_9AGAR|nr:hypothetical protein B0H16DRAFT_1449369 [Mycena metata]
MNGSNKSRAGRLQRNPQSGQSVRSRILDRGGAKKGEGKKGAQITPVQPTRNHAKRAITTAIYLPIKDGGAPSHLMSGAQLSPIKGGGAPSRLNTAISSRQTRRRVRTGAKNGGKFLKKIPATQATTCIDVRDTSDISGISFIECEAITSGACRCD